MKQGSPSERQRVLVPHALGSNEFLRVTWHRARHTVVVSQWDGAECIAAIPVRADDLRELAQLLTDATAGESLPLAWPEPDPSRLVVPAHGLAVPLHEHCA